MRKHIRLLLIVVGLCLLALIWWVISQNEHQATQGETALFHVYFTQGNKVVPVARHLSKVKDKEVLLTQLLQALLKGPTKEEEDAHIYSQIPRGARLLGVRINGKTAYVDFSQELANIGGAMRVLGTLRQITYTATEVPGVSQVQLLLEGEEVKVFSGEGVLLEEPLSRAEGPTF